MTGCQHHSKITFDVFDQLLVYVFYNFIIDLVIYMIQDGALDNKVIEKCTYKFYYSSM